ncbi:MAG: amino acid adenylation domain-containing protein [Gemmatimonadales bacterium]
MTDLLQREITAQAARRPDALAIVHPGERLTYGELEEESNRLARLLRDAGCARGDRVCLLLPKGPAVVVAILGVLKADAVWVPLDPASPPARIRKVITSCDCRWILAAEAGVGVLDELFEDAEFAAGHAVGWLSAAGAEARRFRPAFTRADVAAYSPAPVACANGPDDAAHLLFTSGSTGIPKGVIITHRTVLHFVRWARGYFGTSPGDRVSWHPPLHFDLSTFDLFGTLGAGASLYPVPPELSLLPHRLAEFIRSAQLTQWFSVPSVLNYMAKFDAVRPGDFPSVRRLLWCGEVLPTPTLIYWMQRLPHAVFTNLYGPTETTIASSYYTVPACPTDERADIPIGRACPGEELLVLDDQLRPVAPGEIGDLYIAGAGLSPGYWRDEEKTRLAFLPSPFGGARDRIYRTGDLARIGADGLVTYVGRADTQIKSRGYRIELGEIETALHSLGILRECAVVAVPTEGFEGMAICCAYVPNAADGVPPARLREGIAQIVPNYMLPSRWQDLDALPKNVNGKIDRPALRALFGMHEAPTA